MRSSVLIPTKPKLERSLFSRSPQRHARAGGWARLSGQAQPPQSHHRQGDSLECGGLPRPFASYCKSGLNTHAVPESAICWNSPIRPLSRSAGRSCPLRSCLLRRTEDGLGKRYPVSGTVKYNGSPLEKGEISFVTEDMSKNFGATGTITNGSYTLSMGGDGDGAQAGKYKVTISAKEDYSEKAQADFKKETGGTSPKLLPNFVGKAAAAAKSLIPAGYGDARTTTLKAEVEAKSNTLDFNLSDAERPQNRRNPPRKATPQAAKAARFHRRETRAYAIMPTSGRRSTSSTTEASSIISFRGLPAAESWTRRSTPLSRPRRTMAPSAESTDREAEYAVDHWTLRQSIKSSRNK